MGNVILAQVTFAIANVLGYLLTLYWWIVLIAVVLAFVNPDPYNTIVRFLRSVTEPVFYQVRRRLPFLVPQGRGRQGWGGQGRGAPPPRPRFSPHRRSRFGGRVEPVPPIASLGGGAQRPRLLSQQLPSGASCHRSALLHDRSRSPCHRPDPLARPPLLLTALA